MSMRAAIRTVLSGFLVATALIGCAKTETFFTELQVTYEGGMCFLEDQDWSYSIDTYILDVYETDSDTSCDLCYGGKEAPCLRRRQCLSLDRHDITSAADVRDDVRGLEIGPVSPNDPLCVRLLGLDMQGETIDCESLDPLTLYSFEDFVVTNGPDGICATYTMGQYVLSIGDGVIELQLCPLTAEMMSTMCLGWQPQ